MDHFEYKSGVYHAEDVSLETLAETVGTPFYCYSSATITRHYEVFSGHFPGAKICFAVKANGNLAVLKTLAKLGCGADVVSEGEIRLALAAGIAPDNIVFSGVGKTAAEMRFALEQQIFQFNIESEPELELLNDVAAAMGKRAAIAVRVNPDVDPKTHAKIATGKKASKFGIPMSQALAVYQKAARMPGIRVQSVSVHIGSQLTQLEPFRQAFAMVREFVEELRAAGIAIEYVDLGGGLGIPYGKEAPPLPDAYAEIVQRETKGLNCKLVFEPGRVLVGNAGVLVTRVIYVKRSEDKIFVIVDAAMNDLIRPTLYEAYHEIVPVRPDAAAPTELVDIVGPVCETGDVFAESRLMKVPKAGDLLVLRSAGAYGAVMASTYNARLLVPEIMVHGSKSAIVRPRPTYEEMIARDAIPEWR
ncbi:MAG: diaminopimelate decarboxylase [Alphaproteobacteria bacterium]|nr:diaminopimelate decarboxylase [Alphaproteobacteria bacterium]